jgi:two-component system cell cycle response regulator DivK
MSSERPGEQARVVVVDSASEAREKGRLKSEYLANLSHELRTPLQAIIGFAELMFRGKVGPVSDEHKEYLGDILDSSRHLLQLINGMRDFAATELWKEEPRMDPGGEHQPLARRTSLRAGILVVDDNAASAKLVRIVLEHEGYEVQTAADAEEAVRTLSAWTPRLILMDVQLPGVDGLELTRRLRADGATKDLVILALTASATKGDEEKARAAGCDGFIEKPIDVGSLPRIIQEHLGARTPSA